MIDTAERKLNSAEGTHFVMTMLGLVSEAQEQLIAELDEKRHLLDELEERIARCKLDLSERSLDVLFYAAQMELFDAFHETRMADVAAWLGVSRPTARKSFDELILANLIVRVNKRPPVFRLSDTGRNILKL